ncbi:MAG TPA: membrane protein insertion efficiency factor YidD [Kineosporiaceae bacterium]|nr:membrane protein insertion efficiency factor YidD [Kineosporiaceae bacterium]
MSVRFARALVRLPRQLVVLLLRAYRAVISPMYGPTCRFYPSCSEYALIAVDRHGVLRGGRLAAWRLLRCNPWNSGGVDTVPPVGGDVSSAEECTTSAEGSTASAGTTPAPSSLRRVA